MKNAKNIQKITTSLFLAATLVLGSVSFAVPGIMPSAFAATENLVVSADNNLFDKSFNGPMVIEIVVNDNDIDEDSDLEPDVTLNGGNLKMIQAGDGNWYAYIVQNQSSHGLTNLFGTGVNLTTTPFVPDTTDAVQIYVDADVVVRQPKEPSTNPANDPVAPDVLWPVIQAFDFAVDGSVTITYAKGGNPQSIALTFLDDPDDYASLSLDRSSYPAGADVHMTITSLAHNIDPTDEDSWTYDLTTGNVTYQQFNENGVGNSTTGVDLVLADLNFDDSGLLDIIENPNNASVDIIQFQNNADQNKSDDASAFVTILETQPNSGIFKNTDDGDKANIFINNDAPRGYTAVIDYADSPISVPVRNYPGSLTMDVSGIGGTWNGGEEITVTLDDGDLNLNSLVDQDIELDNWNTKIPTVIVGSPLTLKTANFWTNASVETYSNSTGTNETVGSTTYVNAPFTLGLDLEIDPFSHRVMIEPFIPRITDVVQNSTTNVVTYTNVTAVNASNASISFNSFDNEDFDNTKYFYYQNTNDGLMQIWPTENTHEESIVADGSILVFDIFRFGQSAEDIESAATTRKADAIYRMLLEETGDNTAMYTGSIEYTALNQLNVGNNATYIGLATIDDEITIIVPTDLTDEDAVRVDYLDTDGEGIATQIGDQVDAPTHSGIVSFDGSNYKVADTVTVTLTDADLNTDSDTTEVYTLADDPTYGDRIGEVWNRSCTIWTST